MRPVGGRPTLDASAIRGGCEEVRGRSTHSTRHHYGSTRHTVCGSRAIPVDTGRHLEIPEPPMSSIKLAMVTISETLHRPYFESEAGGSPTTVTNDRAEHLHSLQSHGRVGKARVPDHREHELVILDIF